MNSNISDFITINLVFVGGAAADNYIEDVSEKLKKKLVSVCAEMKKKPYLIEEAERIADIIAKIRQNVMSDLDWIDVIEIINNKDEDNTITFTRNVPRFEHSDNTITFTGNVPGLDNSDNTITFSATLRRVEGDGNCMFRAISASLEQKGIYIPHSSLREMAINYIGDRYTKEELANLIRSSEWAGLTTYGDLDNDTLAIKYLDVMENIEPSGSDKNSYIWGGDIEI
uniref:OTU domain-containing protein n=1 Tax=uncultured Psychrobacter sp. TaxID=259303 RepID=UPI0032B0F9AB